MSRPSLKKLAYRGACLAGYLAVFVMVAQFGYQSYAKMRAVSLMAKAANQFAASLEPAQKAKAMLAFDNANRTDWHFIPRDRQGLPLKEMNETQRKLAHELLKTGLSASGYKNATDVISLEPVLRVLEGPNRKWPRDETLYYLTIFGTPGAKDQWGWRWEGHHMSLNYTIVKGEMMDNTPQFFGSNPAEVREGERKGFRALAGVEDKGWAMFNALDQSQHSTVVVRDKTYGDIINMPDKGAAKPQTPEGLSFSKMTKPQQAALKQLVDEYLGRMPVEGAQTRRAKINQAGWDKVSFAWAGATQKNGQPYYYRVQGPTFIIEYDCTQNNGNHIHSDWRDFNNGDFGRNLMAEHIRQDHKGE